MSQGLQRMVLSIISSQIEKKLYGEGNVYYTQDKDGNWFKNTVRNQGGTDVVLIDEVSEDEIPDGAVRYDENGKQTSGFNPWRGFVNQTLGYLVSFLSGGGLVNRF